MFASFMNLDATVCAGRISFSLKIEVEVQCISLGAAGHKKIINK